MTLRRVMKGMAVAGALLLLGCAAGVTVSQDYAPGIDFAALKSYVWRAGAGGAEGPGMNALVAGRIRSAVERVLTAKGWRQEASGADVELDFRYRIERGREPGGISTGIGLGTGSRGSFGGIGIGLGDIGGGDRDQAVLTLDFLERRSGSLLWQGRGERAASIGVDPEQSALEINELVERILAQFPPAKK
ncbi:MAG: DUF4136 domain-containing protein [Deltaproteobacteria bacterium]|nr:DUF4136 domain-containing protein [Deltaproteobacteria bacterium]